MIARPSHVIARARRSASRGLLGPDLALPETTNPQSLASGPDCVSIVPNTPSRARILDDRARGAIFGTGSAQAREPAGAPVRARSVARSEARRPGMVRSYDG